MAPEWTWVYEALVARINRVFSFFLFFSSLSFCACEPGEFLLIGAHFTFQQDMQQPSSQHLHAEDTILKGIGLCFSNPSSPSDSGRRKRPNDDSSSDADVSVKKGPAVIESLPPPQPATISNKSELMRKNQMLLELLSKQPANPTPPTPHAATSLISDYPSSKLPKFLPPVSSSSKSTTHGE